MPKNYEFKKYFLDEEILAKVILLDRAYFPWPWQEKDWRSLDFKNRHSLFLLLEGNEVIGFSLFEIFPLDKMVHLLKIVINSEYRANGLGKILLKKSLDYFAEDYQRCFLEVATENNAAVRLYASMSFEVIHKKKKFYSDGSDAFAMQCDFN